MQWRNIESISISMRAKISIRYPCVAVSAPNRIKTWVWVRRADVCAVLFSFSVLFFILYFHPSSIPFSSFSSHPCGGPASCVLTAHNVKMDKNRRAHFSNLRKFTVIARTFDVDAWNYHWRMKFACAFWVWLMQCNERMDITHVPFCLWSNIFS